MPRQKSGTKKTTLAKQKIGTHTYARQSEKSVTKKKKRSSPQRKHII